MTTATISSPVFDMVTRSLSRVFPYELEAMTAKLAKINKRLGKLGAPAAVLTIGETLIEKDKDTGLMFEVIDEVTVTGPLGRYNGWTAVASLDWTLPTKSGEAWISKFPGSFEAEIPERFRMDKTCSACNTKRARSLTSLWVNEDGDYATLGSNCVLDYIGVDPGNALWIAAATDGLREEGGGRGPELAPSTDYFLAVSDMLTEEWGFTPASSWDGMPTKSAASTYAFGRWTKADKEAFKGLPAPDLDRGKMLRAWALEEYAGDLGDFAYNMRLAAEMEMVAGRTMGILAYLPTAFRKATEEAAEIEAAKLDLPDPVPFGAVKDRVKLLKVEIVKAFTVDTMYGTSRRVTGRIVEGDNLGAIVTTFGSGAGLFGLDAGDRVLWTGTIKALNGPDAEYDPNGVEMARCIIVETDADFVPVPTYVRWCDKCNDGNVYSDDPKGSLLCKACRAK